MRKSVVVPVLCLVVLACLLSGCAGKYADVKKLNTKFVALTETYVADMDVANDAKAVARAMNRYADDLEKIWPRMTELSEKYPELQDKSDPPEALKESQQEAEAVGRKMGGTFMKVMPFMNDPDVKKAQERLGAVMSGN